MISRPLVCCAIACGAVSTGALAPAQVPLDLLDPTPREVRVQVEDSADLAVVGQSFGPEFPAMYSVNGNVGTVEISSETHESMYAGTTPAPVPGSFSPITIEIDLTTFEATSGSASGGFSSGPIGLGFNQLPLATSGTSGFMGPTVSPLYCASQADVDSACTFAPMFCGQTCTVVPGAPYDSLTGLLNLVGIVNQSGCDGSICSGPLAFFASRGDLMLSEAPAPPPASGDDSPCFIATAAYGTPMAHELDGLRRFRDRWLLDNPIGAAFADTYYRLSPPIADRVARSAGFRTAVRAAMAPFLWMHFDSE